MTQSEHGAAEQFRASVEIWRDPAHCLAFMKGRVALYAILRTLGIGEGDEILVPGFTCVVVPAAIAYTGATPVYYDINPVSLQGAPELATAAITGRTRAIIIQHNFGAIAPLGNLPAICQQRGIAIIEDCAHSMGAMIDNKPVGTLGTAAFCSLQWSKPTTTGLGGIARFNDRGLADSAKKLMDAEFAEPPLPRSACLWMLSSLYRTWYRPSWYWTARMMYHWASRRGLIPGSSSPSELACEALPDGYRERFGKLRFPDLDAALRDLPDLLLHRRLIHSFYAHRIAQWDVWKPAPEAPGAIGVALRFPLLAEDREELLATARRHRLEIGDWFNAPLHPRGSLPGAFGYRKNSCPVAEAAASRAVNLPTHRHVGIKEAEQVLRLVSQHGRLTSVSEWEATTGFSS